MFLIFASSTSVMTVLGWIRWIRVITQGWVWRVVFLMLQRFFFFLLFFLLCSESDDEESDESDDDGSGSDVTFGSWIVSIRVGISEIGSDRIISIRVRISSIVSRSSIFCSSIWFFLSQVTIFSMFSSALWSRCNICIVSKSNSLRYLRNANFSFLFLRSSWVAIPCIFQGPVRWDTQSICLA